MLSDLPHIGELGGSSVRPLQISRPRSAGQVFPSTGARSQREEYPSKNRWRFAGHNRLAESSARAVALTASAISIRGRSPRIIHRATDQVSWRARGSHHPPVERIWLRLSGSRTGKRFRREGDEVSPGATENVVRPFTASAANTSRLRAGRRSRRVCGAAQEPVAECQFPLSVPDGSIRNATQCRARYSAIFDQTVVDAIAAQQFETLFVNTRGVMIGNGEVWLSGVCQDRSCQNQSVTIVAVNRRPLEEGTGKR
jgi:hypothetical protein